MNVNNWAMCDIARIHKALHRNSIPHSCDAYDRMEREYRDTGLAESLGSGDADYPYLGANPRISQN